MFYTVLVSLLFVYTAITDQKVKYAAVIYRHGDRTPVDTYPTDPWKNESLWPVKFGQLTNTGIRQHYALGQWLRKRYSHLLSDHFDNEEIYIKSTDVDRTLMSAQANLAGMYPPIGKSIWNDTLLWQPIPVHTVPEKMDEILAMKRKCIPYINEREKYLQSTDYKEGLKKYQGLMNYLTAYTGKKVKDYTDIDDIYSVLYIETLYNFTLPNWTQTVYPDKLRKPACFSFSTATATPLMARLLVGPLIKDIVTNMKTAITNDKHLKVSIYSGHDFTIGNILTGLGVYDGNCPVYTSTVFFELIEDNSTMTYYVRFSYRNSTEIVKPLVIYIPHCGTMCPFERFLKLYDNLVTVDWINECRSKPASQLSVILLSATPRGVILLISILCLMYIIYRIYSNKFAEAPRKVSIFTYASLRIPVTEKKSSI